MRSAEEIVDENLGEPFHLQRVYEIVRQTQKEALEAAANHCLRVECVAECGYLAEEIRALVPKPQRRIVNEWPPM